MVEVTAATQIRSLVWKLSYATGMVKKGSERERRTKKKKRVRWNLENLQETRSQESND